MCLRRSPRPAASAARLASRTNPYRAIRVRLNRTRRRSRACADYRRKETLLKGSVGANVERAAIPRSRGPKALHADILRVRGAGLTVRRWPSERTAVPVRQANRRAAPGDVPGPKLSPFSTTGAETNMLLHPTAKA